VDLSRVRFTREAEHRLDASQAHVMSCLEGGISVSVDAERYQIERHVHCYLPRGAKLEGRPGTQLVIMSGDATHQARGETPLVRDERFLQGAASDRSLRWILTPQYLSRRIFLHHDKTLLSKARRPVSWFRTTMFDVRGLPKNDEGQSVFKMSYNYRTEPNVCYRVIGDARVRMARHPYSEGAGQAWGPWYTLDGETTYHLDEPTTFDGIDVGPSGPLRNRHEVDVRGHVTLLCAFDPAPTGAERHRPGAYSDYGSVEEAQRSPEYEKTSKDLASFDAIVDVLSLAKARGEDPRQAEPEAFAEFERGQRRQREIERQLLQELIQSGSPRAKIVEDWLAGGEPAG
jgi:hypothetical protein